MSSLAMYILVQLDAASIQVQTCLVNSSKAQSAPLGYNVSNIKSDG